MIEENEFEVRDMRHKEKFQIDDLYLNGYAKKCGIYATGVYVSLCRHVDKNQKCFPSLNRIAEELDISSRQVSRAVKVLEDTKIIRRIRIGKKANNRYLLLDKSEWTDSPITIDSQSSHPMTDSLVHSKDTHIKDTHSKDITEWNSVDLNSMIELFKSVNPSYKELFKRPPQRNALSRLIKEHGQDRIEWAIGVLPKTNAMKYSPTITSPVQLENKLGDLIAFIKKEQGSSRIVKL